MGLNIGGKIERVDGKELSYKEFVERYMQRNQPVLLTGLMDGWRACSDWVTEGGLPNLHFFSENFGKSFVQVADCCKREFTDQKRIEMSVSDFVSYWFGHYSADCGNGSSCNSNAQSFLYLKDWHFVKEYPDYVAYTTPPFFTDDWLNLYLDFYNMHRNSDVCHDGNEISCSDYRFVYMGAKGTWTPLHADVFRSYSWSANVCGKKQWYFLPPSQCHLLFDGYLKNSVYDIFDNVSETKFPGFKKTVWLECTQEQNEVIFVPSGWYHQVHNLKDTISINHNWFNGYNLSWVWNLLRKDHNEAKNYIQDVRDICDDFEGLCQRNLAANTGMSFLDFFGFLVRMSFANLIHLCNLKNEEDSTSCKVRHLIYNTSAIRNVASIMISAEAFTAENLHRWSAKNHGACFDIAKVFEEQEFLELCLALNRTYELTNELPVQDPITHITSLCSKGSSLMSHLKAVCENFDFLKVCGSKMNGPVDLIQLIDHILTSCSGLYSVDLLSDVHDLETSAVLEQNCL